VILKVVGSAATTVALLAAWGWVQLRPHILRKVGAEAVAKQQTSSNAVLFLGLLVVSIASIWAPKPGGIWIACTGACGVGIAYVAIRLREAAHLRQSPNSRDPGIVQDGLLHERRRYRRLPALIFGVEAVLTVATGVLVAFSEHSFGWGFLAGIITCIMFIGGAPMILGVIVLYGAGRDYVRKRRAQRRHSGRSES
jgi:hypothetical protein